MGLRERLRPRARVRSVRDRARTQVRESGLRYHVWRGDRIPQLFAPDSWVAPKPFSLYEAMRRRGPVFRSPTSGLYVTTSYEAANTVLKDDRFHVIPRGGYDNDRLDMMSSASLLRIDPPRHTQIRKLVNKGLSARAVESLGESITELTHELLDRVEGDEVVDIIDALAYPLPITVVARILGMPEVDLDMFATWAHALGPGIDPFITREQAIAARDASDSISGYFADLVEQRRHSPADDVISALIAARDEGGHRLTDEELLSNCQLMLIAGFGTMTGMIGHGMDMFVDRPDLWRQMQDHPELIPNAVEEILRLEHSIQLTVRYTYDDELDILGETVPPESTVIVLLAAGSRDPSMFPKPATFDLYRDNAGKHLAFAGGAHYCLGAPLARLQGRIAFTALTQRMPAISRGGTPTRRPFLVARGLDTMPVRVTPAVMSRTA